MYKRDGIGIYGLEEDWLYGWSMNHTFYENDHFIEQVND